MDHKEVKHHKHENHTEHKNSEHHKEHSEHHKDHTEHKSNHSVKPSGFSLFKHRIADVFKEIVEAPPEEKKVEVEKEVEGEIRITAVESDLPENDFGVVEVSKKEDKPEIHVEEDVEEEDVELKEREEMREKIHQHIVSNLNEAVSKWKETGEVGVRLEPPVPWREKVKSFWSQFKFKSVPLGLKVKEQVDFVMQKVESRMKKAESSGVKIDSDSVVREEWSKVIEKIESVGSPSERDEIEKIYKELSGK